MGISPETSKLPGFLDERRAVYTEGQKDYKIII